jgi:hypothetical protein
MRWFLTMWRFSPPQLEVLGMRKLFGGLVLAAVALSLPAAAQAQRRAAATGGARHEFGVDVGVAYIKPSNVDGGIGLLAPFDLRYGIMPRSGKLMWEPHLAINYRTVGGQTFYVFTPGIHALYANSTGGHRRGMFFEGGAGLVMGDQGGGSGTAFQLGAAVGWRKPYEGAAWRYKLGFTWVSSSNELAPLFADYIAIGGSIGISLWH